MDFLFDVAFLRYVYLILSCCAFCVSCLQIFTHVSSQDGTQIKILFHISLAILCFVKLLFDSDMFIQRIWNPRYTFILQSNISPCLIASLAIFVFCHLQAKYLTTGSRPPLALKITLFASVIAHCLCVWVGLALLFIEKKRYYELMLVIARLAWVAGWSVVNAVGLSQVMKITLGARRSLSQHFDAMEQQIFEWERVAKRLIVIHTALYLVLGLYFYLNLRDAINLVDSENQSWEFSVENIDVRSEANRAALIYPVWAVFFVWGTKACIPLRVTPLEAATTPMPVMQADAEAEDTRLPPLPYSSGEILDQSLRIS